MDKNKLQSHLTDKIIPFWNNLCDLEQGGFFGYVNEFLDADKKSDKGVILNNRILWFYSAAYELTGDTKLLEYAKHAYLFFAKKCYDMEFGGVFWSVSYDGKPVDTTKHTYNQAFAIYALSKYYEVSKDEGALVYANELFELIESKCRNNEGYLESFRYDFEPEENDKLSENGVMAERTMNTLLHVMEAYTELYKVSDNKKVLNCLIDIIRIFEEKVINKNKGCFDVFFDMNYNSIIDLDSYGHDIEASWLLDRCADVIKDQSVTNKIHKMSDMLAKHVYECGVDKIKGAVFNEIEYGKIDKQHIWWVQAEAVTGFYNAWQKDNTNVIYKEIAEDIYSFIISNLIDPRCGEWYESIKEDGTVDISRGMVHAWKCPYHTGRMYIEMINRLGLY